MTLKQATRVAKLRAATARPNLWPVWVIKTGNSYHSMLVPSPLIMSRRDAEGLLTLMGVKIVKEFCGRTQSLGGISNG